MESSDLRKYDPFNGSQGNGSPQIQGMESVVATVSGYHGAERFKLIKLIAQTGANYVGAMTKSTTHVVCWQFEGKKYNMARSIGAHIISHQWFEDCLKERKRLPEEPYTKQSGQEAGPITWEVPALDASVKEKRITSSERNVLSDKSDALNCINTADIDVRYLNWSESHLLDKNEETSPLTNLCSSSNKRNLFDATQDDVTYEPARRSRRLKKKAYCNLSDYMNLDQKQGTCAKKSTEHCENTSHELGSSKNGLNNNECLKQGNSAKKCTEHYEHISQGLGSSENGVNDDEYHKGDDNIYESDAYKQTELSCVICWTEFCTTRAVLPCGHRFCYSCIQGWADCMASRGKVSTCPLCKASFTSIRQMEDASTDQKIYSQTIPCGSSNMDIFMLSNNENSARTWMPMESVCYECHNREPEDLLLCCHICESQWVHSYCLDPPLIPWTCIHCRDLRTLYQRFR